MVTAVQATRVHESRSSFGVFADVEISLGLGFAPIVGVEPWSPVVSHRP